MWPCAPGEVDDDVKRSVDAVLSADVDHVSAYSLIIERGTAMFRKVRRGELTETDEDTLARRYDIIDDALSGQGFSWYEVSNWSRPDGECRHNLVYWRDGDCIPKLTRVNPASRSPEKNSGEVDSGLASVVTSAPGLKPIDERTALSARVNPSAPTRDGVPPPTNTVSAGGRW